MMNNGNFMIKTFASYSDADLDKQVNEFLSGDLEDYVLLEEGIRYQMALDARNALVFSAMLTLKKCSR